MTQNEEIILAIEKANHIVITSHRSPDGDSIGSSMAMFQYLTQKGKSVSVCHPDIFPNFLSWVDDVAVILDYETKAQAIDAEFDKADLIFALDYNHPSRLGKDMEILLDGMREKTILIDHHLDPSDFAAMNISKPEVCSTCQLIFELIESDKTIQLDSKIGTPIYLGLMTDTGSFRFNSVTSRTHEIVAVLLSLGVDHTAIHEAIFGQNSLNQLRLRSYAICNKLEIISDGKAAIISMTNSELETYHYEKGDTEGLVNVALSVTGVQMAVFLKEDNDKVKMSFRSKGNQVVNLLASENFEGGGHAYAAGGISFASMDETLSKLKKLIPNYIV